jgi:hypothetical protein
MLSRTVLRYSFALCTGCDNKCIEPRTEPSFSWLFLIYIRWFCSSDIYFSINSSPANLVYFAEK